MPPTVATTRGGRVHRACADREAAHAWRLGVSAALVHAALLGAVVVGLAVYAGSGPGLIAVLLAWGAIHLVLHARFWHIVARDVRRWLGRHD